MSATKTRQEGQIQVVSIEGKMEPALVDRIRDLLPDGNRIVIDLSGARDLRGDDLERLVESHHLCRAAGGQLVLTELPADLKYILNLMQLDLFFTIYRSVEKALSVLSGPPTGSGASTMRIVAKEKDRLDGKEGLEVVDTAQVARQRVERVKTCIRYLAPGRDRIELLGRLATTVGPIEIDDLAGRFDRPWLEGVLQRLDGLRVLDRDVDGNLYYDPAPTARAMIEDILRMWEDPENQERMEAWGSDEVIG